jgi:hypothetical protein
MNSRLQNASFAHISRHKRPDGGFSLDFDISSLGPRLPKSSDNYPRMSDPLTQTGTDTTCDYQHIRLKNALHLAAPNSNREQAEDAYFFVHRSTQSLTVL